MRQRWWGTNENEEYEWGNQRKPNLFQDLEKDDAYDMVDNMTDKELSKVFGTDDIEDVYALISRTYTIKERH